MSDCSSDLCSSDLTIPCCGIGTGHKRYGPANDNTGLLVVECHKVRCGKNIDTALLLHGACKHTQIDHLGYQNVYSAPDHSQTHTPRQGVDGGARTRHICTNATPAQVGHTPQRRCAPIHVLGAAPPHKPT